VWTFHASTSDYFRSRVLHLAYLYSDPLCCRVVKTSCMNLTRLSIFFRPVEMAKSIMFVTCTYSGSSGLEFSAGTSIILNEVFRTFPQSLQTNAGTLYSITSAFKIYYSLPTIHSTLYVPYLLKARIAEPEKQTLLVNGSETTLVSRQWQRNKQRNRGR
jgi:hypothetical protein